MKVYSEYGSIFRDLIPKILVSGDVGTIMQLLKTDARLARKERENPEEFWKAAFELIFPEYIHNFENVKDYKKVLVWITYSHNKILKFMKIKKIDNVLILNNDIPVKLVDFVKNDLTTPTGCLLDVHFSKYRNTYYVFDMSDLKSIKNFYRSFFRNQDEKMFFGFYWGPDVFKKIMRILIDAHNSSRKNRSFLKTDWEYFNPFNCTDFDKIPYPKKEEKIYLGHDIF